MTTAAQLIKGKWTARWGNWLVELQWKSTNWEVTVWRQLPGKKFRHALGSYDGFATTEEAIDKACKVMKDDGAYVLITDRPDATLKSFLSFKPRMELVLA